jgi:adenylate kinase
MPCNSDYMNQTDKERQLQETAKLLVYVIESVGAEPSKRVLDAAADYYCKYDTVPVLCNWIRHELDPEQIDKIMYDGRNPMARRLADWWEKHDEADQKREAAEKEMLLNNARATLRNSLTPQIVHALETLGVNTNTLLHGNTDTDGE